MRVLGDDCSNDSSCEEESEEDSDDFEEEEEDPYGKKIRLLNERMAAVQEDSDRLATKISAVNRWIRHGASERKFLISRLDAHGDNFRSIPLMIPFPGEKAVPSPEKGRRVKRKKGKVDPLCPKRPQNPFFQFCQENRGRVAKEYASEEGVLSKKELTKILGSKWNEMTSADKKVYYDLYERDKAHYGERLQRYKEEQSWKASEDDTDAKQMGSSNPH